MNTFSVHAIESKAKKYNDLKERTEIQPAKEHKKIIVIDNTSAKSTGENATKFMAKNKPLERIRELELQVEELLERVAELEEFVYRAMY